MIGALFPLDHRHRPLTATLVARPVSGGWALMNRQLGGYASQGIEYRTLAEIPRYWQVVQGADGKDEHGPFVTFHRKGEDDHADGIGPDAGAGASMRP